MDTQKKPPWLKKRVSSGHSYGKVVNLLRRCRLHTVCESAHCPNLGECFAKGTATFMILGDVCTRNCRFCAVLNGQPDAPQKEEPGKVADAVEELGLTYAVLTSVTRDDLPDGGAGHFAKTISAIKAKTPHPAVEVLIPDFEGSNMALETVVAAGPDVVNHNLETVPRLYPQVRPEANYRRSLDLLQKVREIDPGMMTKSGLMLGLGERREELRASLGDLLSAGCRALTLGQYLAPSRDHHPVVEYIHPDVFAYWEKTAYEMGFEAVASGPFVRSSFQAERLFEQMKKATPAHL